MMTKTAKIDGHNACEMDWEEGDAEKRKPQIKLPKQKFWFDQNTVMVFTAQTIIVFGHHAGSQTNHCVQNLLNATTGEDDSKAVIILIFFFKCSIVILHLQ